jgi:hypothetical protein
MSEGEDAAAAAAAAATKAAKRREIEERIAASKAKTAMDQKASEMAKIAKTQVVLVGEHHADDLGECITDIVSSTPDIITCNIIICREQIVTVPVQFTTSRSSKLTSHTMMVQPLETGGETFDYKQPDMWQQRIHECTSSRIADAYYVLDNITSLLIDEPVSGNCGGCDEIMGRYGNIIANLPDEDRPPFLELFKNIKALKASCKNKLTMAKLYQMVYDLLKKLLSSDLEKYAQFMFQEEELQIEGKGTGVTAMVMADNMHNTRLGKRLIQQTQMERDVRMVDKLKNIVCGLPVGEKQLVAVVVVGDEHFVNMKRLMSAQGFQIIGEQRSVSVSTPQKNAIVIIRAGTELDGSFGYIMGDCRKEHGTWPVFVSGQPDIMWLNADDFIVEGVNPEIEELHKIFGNPPGEPLTSYIATMHKKSGHGAAGAAPGAAATPGAPGLGGGGGIRRGNKKSKKTRRKRKDCRKSKRVYRYRSRKL